MSEEILPSILKGEIKAPPSKSMSHRALIAAALSNGISKISNVAFSEDIIATIKALEQIGATFKIKKDIVIVKGVKSIKQPHRAVDCNESGSTLRFLIPIFSLCNKEVIFTGKESLLKRPQTVYEKIFKKKPNYYKNENDKIMVKGFLKPKNYIIDGSVSSQFITGLLYSLPLLNGNSTIEIVNTLESKSYIDLTIDMLQEFNIQIKTTENGYLIEGNQVFSPSNYKVEGDYSQAAFFLVGGAINGGVKVTDLMPESKQGDRAIVDVLSKVNSPVIHMENGLTTVNSNTKGTIVDISNCPDLGPIISLLLCVSKGTSKIINAGRLRIKESDRIESTVQTLSALGANIKSVNDEIIIQGKKTLQGGITVDSYNDHRIAMMISIAASLCENPVILTNPMAINKSYPSFYIDYKSIGGIIK